MGQNHHTTKDEQSHHSQNSIVIKCFHIQVIKDFTTTKIMLPQHHRPPPPHPPPHPPPPASTGCFSSYIPITFNHITHGTHPQPTTFPSTTTTTTTTIQPPPPTNHTTTPPPPWPHHTSTHTHTHTSRQPTSPQISFVLGRSFSRQQRGVRVKKSARITRRKQTGKGGNHRSRMGCDPYKEYVF